MEEEKILEKFYEEDAQQEEAENENMFTCLGLTREKEFEFTQAFALVAGEGVEAIPREKVIDVFFALGYHFQEWDLKNLLSQTNPDKDGKYNCDLLLEAFEVWEKAQLTPHDLYTAFMLLKEKVGLVATLPSLKEIKDYENVENIEFQDAIEVFSKMLNEVLCTHAGNAISKEEVIGVIEEISSNPDSSISFEDFIRIFTL